MWWGCPHQVDQEHPVRLQHEDDINVRRKSHMRTRDAHGGNTVQCTWRLLWQCGRGEHPRAVYVTHRLNHLDVWRRCSGLDTMPAGQRWQPISTSTAGALCCLLLLASRWLLECVAFGRIALDGAYVPALRPVRTLATCRVVIPVSRRRTRRGVSAGRLRRERFPAGSYMPRLHRLWADAVSVECVILAQRDPRETHVP